MRVILDANVWISYLLDTNNDGTIVRLVEGCFAPHVTLVFPQELQAEIHRSVTNSSYLSQRIPSNSIADLIGAVSAISEVPPSLADPADSVSRDLQDDYLIAYGLLCDVDFLVTGDLDLLVLGKIDSLSIVTPATFVRRF